jgi:hypothetical protein
MCLLYKTKFIVTAIQNNPYNYTWTESLDKRNIY